MVLHTLTPLIAESVPSIPRTTADSAQLQALASGLSMALSETQSGDLEISVEELRVRAGTPKAAWRIYKRSLREDRKGYRQESLRLALHAIKIAPDFFPAHAALAAAYLRSGDLESAGRELRITLALNSNYRPGYELRGIFLYLCGDVNHSVTTLRAVLEKTPTRPVAHYFLACALRDLGEAQTAREHFDAAEKLRRTPPRPIQDDGYDPARDGY